MAPKIENIEITITKSGGSLKVPFKKFKGAKKDYDFEGLSALRKVLSNEKIRLLHIIKNKKPGSILSR